jgi:FKBP-type peptidyl-prolyl cis-trans isomerase
MRSSHVWILGGLMGVSLAGCEDPGPIIPTTPPGAVFPKTDPNPDASQAQGEMPAATKPDAASAKATDNTPALPTAKGESKTTKSGVIYETLKEGTGPAIAVGQTGKFLYEGKLEDGTVFDKTGPTRETRPFQIGVGKMTKGWEEAIPGMKTGEIRKLTVPPAAAYGPTGFPPKIPPNATLIFEVELVEVL